MTTREHDPRVVPRAGRLRQRVEEPVPRWVVLCAGAIPLLLLAGWLTADAVQPASYSPVRQTVSVTAGYAGNDRWIMTGALLLIGWCYLCLSVGFVQLRPAARIGLLVAGSASIGIAVCPEPIAGTNSNHAVCTMVGALAVAVWPALVAQRRSDSRIIGIPACLVVAAVFLGLLGWLAVETTDGSRLGEAERISSSVQAWWPFVVACALSRAAAPTRLRTNG